MKTVGLSVYGVPSAEIVTLAKVADECKFDGLWLGEHLICPIGYSTDHPSRVGDKAGSSSPVIDKGTELVDPLITLGSVAAVTSRMQMATGIYLLPLRHPLATARMTATLQDLAAGRLLFGVGSGWLREEFEAFGIPFQERLGRFRESIDILRRSWSAEEFSYDGRYFSFDTVQVCHEPVRVPLILGGNGPKALAQAAALGDGWFASGTPTFEEATTLLGTLAALRAESPESTGQFDMECYVRVADASRAEVDRYVDAGFANVVVWADQVWFGESLEEKASNLRRSASRLGLV